MRKPIIILVVALTAFLSSCKDVISDYTPYIFCSQVLLNPVFNGDTLVGAADTLGFGYENDAYVLDTISLSGTENALVAVAFGSYSNNLTAFRILYDTTALSVTSQLNDAIRATFVEPTNEALNSFYFAPGYDYISIPVYYHPLKTGSFTMTFVVESDSKYSPVMVKVIQPVTE